MKCKRFMTYLLVVCLLVSAVLPGVSAAGSADMTAQAAPQNAGATTAVNKERVQPAEPRTLKNHSEDASAQEMQPVQKGNWTAVPVEDASSHANAALPASIQELKEAAEIYEESDMVAAFIVLEDTPLVERGYAAISSIPEAQTNQLLKKQDSVIQAIENNVLGGSKLDVRYQFTYLTNAVSVRVEFGNLQKIAVQPGVKTVFLAPTYAPLQDETLGQDVAAPMSGGSSVSSGAQEVWANGYTGAGTKIAVIDTGLDLDHPSFAAAPQNPSLTEAELAEILPRLHAYELRHGLRAQQLYRSEKVPYAFNYVDRSLIADHSADDQGSHGTHVAGIAAANKLDGVGAVGMAPDAQLVIMKVFGVQGGAYADDYVAAVEDALALGCNAINLSLGTVNGFASENPEYDAIFDRIAYCDAIVSISAGNAGTSGQGNLPGTNLNPTANPDSATVSSPSTFRNATSVASAENRQIFSKYISVNGTNWSYSEAKGLHVVFSDVMAGEEKEYAMIGGFGEAEEFAKAEVAGKIAVVSRGSLSFGEKLANAEAAGAIGLIVYNNEPGLINMQMTGDDGQLIAGVSGQVPAILVDQAAYEPLANAPKKVLTASLEQGLVDNPAGGQMSTFSSWGCGSDLRLLPDITGIGGNVYSSVDGGGYSTMSGTSMSAPQIAGLSALTFQYLRETHPNLQVAEMRVIANSLLMSTAKPIISTESQVEASPRQQGAGLANVKSAMGSSAYLVAAGTSYAKAELGDDPDRSGTYEFAVDIRNFSGQDKTYTVSGSLLTEDYVTIHDVEYMAGYDRALSGSITPDKTTVTVAAGRTVRVTVKVQLSQEDRAWLDTHYPNGGYVEGFVYFQDADENGVDLSLPYMGFYGDWTSAPVFDTAFWYDPSFWRQDAAGQVNGTQYYTVFWTDLAGTSYVLGFNPYMGFDPDFVYDPARNVISPNHDGLNDNIDTMYLSMARNAKLVTVDYEDAETGEVYAHVDMPLVKKSSYVDAYGQVVPTMYSWYAQPYDFTDAHGNPLPNGTRLHVTFRGISDYDVHVQDQTGDSFTIPIVVDTQKPEIVDVDSYVKDGRNYLTVTVTDNTAVAAVLLTNPTDTQTLASVGDPVLEDGKAAVTFDVTGYGNELGLVVGDYGANENFYVLKYTEDDNLPEVNKNALYAYRVNDSTYGPYDQSFYGWVTLEKDKEPVGIQQLTNDQNEYYALTAAEYAGGYIFAVDAGNHLLVIRPGVWNRKTICDLGVFVGDLAFDPTTNTMYAAVRYGSGDGMSKLVTLDVMTGELTDVKDYGSTVVRNIAITDDGQFFASVRNKSDFYRLNSETWELEPVISMAEDHIMPYYADSMTYSHQDGRIYWAHYGTNDKTACMLVIDPVTLTYEKKELDHAAEFVGLLTMEEIRQDYHCDADSCPSKEFTDVDPSHFYHDGVDYVLQNGYMLGVAKTRFAPNSGMDRAMVATVLHRMAGSPEATGNVPFTDVPAGSYYEEAVRWCYANGLTMGTSATTFSPKALVTREQLVTFLHRFTAFTGIDTSDRYDSLAQFTDLDQVSSFALEAMRWAVGEGIILGASTTTISPRSTATRGQFATMLLRLYYEVTGGYQIPSTQLQKLLVNLSNVNGNITHSADLLLSVGQSETATASPLPWNAPSSNISWSSSNEDVATVNGGGKVTGVSAGTAEITATCGEVSATITVKVLEPTGQFRSFRYASLNELEDSDIWLDLDLAKLPGNQAEMASDISVLAADYNGHDGWIYGYDELHSFYRIDPTTGTAEKLSNAPAAQTVYDMAYDYSTGFMYALGYSANGTCAINLVDLRTGRLEVIATSTSPYNTLACSTEGILYSVDGSTGAVVQLELQDGEIHSKVLIETGLGTIYLIQSMAYDHNENKLIWTALSGTGDRIFWIDPEAGDYLPIASTGSNANEELVGTYVTPLEGAVPARKPVAPEKVVVNYPASELVGGMPLLTMVAGATKRLDVSVSPLNATVTEEDFSWELIDEGAALGMPPVAEMKGSYLTALNPGVVQVIGTVQGLEEPVVIFVRVLPSAGDIHGYVWYDIGSTGGYYWTSFKDYEPETAEMVSFTSDDIIAGDYYNGKIYAFSYTPWSITNPTSDSTMKVLDPDTYTIEQEMKLSKNLDAISDAVYDYDTSAMYILDDYSLYTVNLSNGEVKQAATFDQPFLYMTKVPGGDFYLINRSMSSGGSDTPEPLTADGDEAYTDAMLYRFNLEENSLECLGSTGMKSNKAGSLFYSPDVNCLYWTRCFESELSGQVEANLCAIDLSMAEYGNATAYPLGTIGAAGAQFTSAYVEWSEYPDEVEQDMVLNRVDITLDGATVTGLNAAVALGNNITLRFKTDPDYMASHVTSSWSSSDTSVAMVDQNGVVTGMGIGSAVITLAVTYQDANVDLHATASCEIKVSDPNASMLAYNTDRQGWSTFQLSAPRLAQNFQADSGAKILTATQIGGDLYGYDADGNFVKVDGRTLERETQTAHALDGSLDVRGLTYDVAHEQLLLLVNQAIPLDETGEETVTLPAIYIVDQNSGIPMEAIFIGVDMTAQVPACSAAGTANGLAADGQGNLYVLFADQANEDNNWIYAVDMSTVEQTGSAALTKVTQPSSKYSVTKCSETAINAMAYNPADGRIYMALTNLNGYCFLHCLDLVAKECVSIDKIGATDGGVTATTDHFSAILFPQ